MLYLSPVWHTLLPQLRPHFGYIQAPHGAGVGDAIRAGYPWLLDNGAFSDNWQEAKWLAALELWQPYAATCIAAVCPDVVGDAAANLARFAQYALVIRGYGYPVAFVTQDGLTMDAVPWNDFDVLFVGGTDHHKLRESWPFIAAAKERGKWVHVGRVNSEARMELFQAADSCDGTMLAQEPTVQRQRRMLRQAQVIQGRKGAPCFMF